MHTFRVVKEPFGWAVRIGSAVATPYRQHSLAVREANRLCEALRVHGVAAEVVIEEEFSAAVSSDLEGSSGRDPFESRRHAAC